MLRHPQCAIGRIDRDGDCVADARCPSLAVALRLTRTRRIEPPDSRARLELRTWILPGRLRLAVPHLTGVRRRANVHEQIVPAYRDRLRGVAPPGRELAHDGVGRGGGTKPGSRKRIANDRVVGSKEELGAAERNARASVVTKALAHIGPSIAGVVAQRDDASPRIARVPNRDEHIAVRRHRNVAHRAQAVSDDCAQKPCGSVMPPLSLSQAGRDACSHAAHRRGAADHEVAIARTVRVMVFEDRSKAKIAMSEYRVRIQIKTIGLHPGSKVRTG